MGEGGNIMLFSLLIISNEGFFTLDKVQGEREMLGGKGVMNITNKITNEDNF